MRQVRRAFTLIEALVAATLLGVGVAAVLLALGGQIRTEVNVRRRETLSGLVRAKLDELSATESVDTATDGDFADQGYPDVTWNSSFEDTGIENLQALTITVSDSESSDIELRETTLIFTPPVTTTAEATP